MPLILAWEHQVVDMFALLFWSFYCLVVCYLKQHFDYRGVKSNSGLSLLNFTCYREITILACIQAKFEYFI
jgi:hypothetical protein